MVRYELHKTRIGAQHYYWRVVSVGNNRVLATSETYYNRQDAINAANLVRFAVNAEFRDYTAAAA